jgi:alpha-ketoglutarate-dependent taurine dioxygenase
MSAARPAEVRIPEDKIVDGRVFPLTLSLPPDVDAPGGGGLVSFIAEDRRALLERAAEHGAVLLRGKGVATPEDFDAVVAALDIETMPYIGGAAVRNRVVGDRVVTANESPPSEPIPFHHEMAQVPEPPDYVIFYCDVPPTSGGETPIVLSNEAYRFVEGRFPAFLARLEAHGVRYVRVLPEEDDPSSAIGRSWKSTYQVETREDAEARMRTLGTSWEWLPGGDLKTTTKALPAIRADKYTGKKTFFNAMIAAYTGWIDARNDPQKAVVLGDDSPVDHEAMMAIAAHLEGASVAFAWQKGDVLILDNHLTMHSRSPFTPPRRILAAVMRARRGG